MEIFNSVRTCRQFRKSLGVASAAPVEMELRIIPPRKGMLL